MGRTSLHVFRTRAGQLQSLRSAVLKQLFASSTDSSRNAGILNDIANSFSRFAAFQQTAFDQGATRSSVSGDAASMKRQVERAITQVLGRATGNDPNVFMNALTSAFPTTPTTEGPAVALTPARSVISLYRADGTADNAYSSSGKNGGYTGTISARQANLYRQATVIARDAIRVLNGLTPFVPEAESDQVEALRALIRSEINALMEEFGRVDEPRNERVLSYFSALRIHTAGFGRRAFLDDPSRAATVEDEAQVAGFELLGSYVVNLRSAWDTFFDKDAGKSSPSFSLSERVERANVLLPVIAQVNTDFEAAMDSVGFAESERRSMNAHFTALERDTAEGSSEGQSQEERTTPLINPQKQLLPDIDSFLPNITVYDLTEWVDRFATIEGPASLAGSGQYGLDFVADQADRIFWVIVPVVAHLKNDVAIRPSASPSLELSLSNERVRFALNNLLGQMNELAKLAVPGEKANTLTTS